MIGIMAGYVWEFLKALCVVNGLRLVIFSTFTHEFYVQGCKWEVI